MNTLTAALSGLACSAVLAHAPVVDDTTSVVRVNVTSQQHLEQLEAAGAEPLACRIGLGEQLFAVDTTFGEALAEEGAVIVERDLKAAIAASRATARGAGFFDDYQPWDQINIKLDELGADPIAEIVTIGDTIQQRTVRGLKIGSDAGGPKPAVLVNGTQHAREWISPAACMFLADMLVTEYGSDARITNILDKVDIYVIPVTNADGYVYSWADDENRFWRKNRRSNGAGSFGVDPNRNWAEAWGQFGSSGNPNSSIYRGPKPFSEPCTANLRDFILATPEIRGHIDVHNFAQLVLGVWAHTNDDAPDGETLLPLGEAMNTAIIAEHNSDFDFRTGEAGIGFAAGTMPDWTFAELGIMGWTYELRDQGQSGFLLPASQIVEASEECAAGVLRLAEQIAECPHDLNLDGVVNADDLAIFIGRWGNDRGLADTDLSGTVGSGDLAGLLAAWGSNCSL